jgi:dienelactone hydrolase
MALTSRAAAVCLLVLVFCAPACGGARREVRLTVTPADSVEDEPLAIRINGLSPRQGVWIELHSVDSSGVAFSARASFAADRRGELDLARARAMSGSSYSGAWPMGLLTSMSAAHARPHTGYDWGSRPHRFVVSVVSQSRRIASTTFVRRWRRGRATSLTVMVAEAGFAGKLYLPAAARHASAVLAFGGSARAKNGPWLGERLAAHGIVALVVDDVDALRRFDRPRSSPLRYLRAALGWLARRPEVDPMRVSVVGWSDGSEEALLLAIRYPRLVSRVVVLVPLPGGRGADTRALLPVERIRAPVLVACGGRDQIGRSCPYGHAIVVRRRAHGAATQLEAYPDASHGVGSVVRVYEPGSLGNDFFVPSDEQAREDLWPRVLRFLSARR